MIHVQNIHIPLPHHTIHEERVVSTTPLLTLPLELVPHVMCYLSKDDLSSVSLVDSVFRELAASELFKTLRIDLSCGNKAFRCMDVLKLLDGSAQSRVSIAPCVRHLIVESRLPLPQSADEMIKRGYNMGPCYVKAMCYLMEKLLSNVYIIDWDITGAMPPHVFQAIVSSSAKHIRIQKTVFTRPFPLTHSSHAHESLHLDLVWFPPETDPPAKRVLSVFDDLLSRSSCSLRQLIWEGCRTKAYIDLQSCTSFPKIRVLTLDQVAHDMDHIIPLFLGESTLVSTLAMDSLSEASREFYRTRGHISTLERFCWINHENDAAYEDVLVFLRANDQIHTFQITSALSSHVLETHFLPLFRSEFKNLTFLKLIWADEQIPDASLEAISELVSLRRLWISAGNQNIYRNTWLINHHVLMERLKPLEQLQMIGFSHDTYESKMHPLAPRFGDYYANKAFPEDLSIQDYLEDEEYDAYRGIGVTDYERMFELQIEMRVIAWERMHRQRMLDVAYSYATAFKCLEWIYIGQLPIARDTAKGQSGVPSMRITVEERDPSAIILSKKLSIKTWAPW
ncbi:hypothetical protein CVT24_000648 [Panaeolus cyanescens]|uniref:F-box domain-containing protein n=1 Tax=Panaeolus cyanescens TaxID=181874 RepID=A0A409YT82_9AGAR|nr:hypothetical protein CVT24_000648 [Panaeolus cyanescens]